LQLRFASLGSGSRGNASLVEFGDTLIMIDCGLPRRVVEERLGALGRSPREIAVVLVTHEHGDHSRGVGAFSRRYGIPVLATHGTASAVRGLNGVKHLSCHRALEIRSIRVEPFPVPHDAREPCQFAFHAGGRKLGVLTDTGHVTPTIVERLAACDALAVECNHDSGLLERGSYPPSVKARVGSRYGHLSNAQTADLVARVRHAGLQWVVGLHLSEENNSVAHACEALAPSLDPIGLSLELATQDAATGWREIF
jgi:phosphoribosyl 1,2-cyclic phosphodiesterase